MEFNSANNNCLVSVLSTTDKTEMYYIFENIKNKTKTNNKKHSFNK